MTKMSVKPSSRILGSIWALSPTTIQVTASGWTVFLAALARSSIVSFWTRPEYFWK